MEGKLRYSIEEQLELHEGFRSKPYKDSNDYLTIGFGRNLDTKGLTRPEARFLLSNDIQEAMKELSEYDWYSKLCPVRKKVLIDMCVNLGISGLLTFKNMIQALKDEQYEAAANEMKNSRWFTQVKERGKRLRKMMLTGEDYDLEE